MSATPARSFWQPHRSFTESRTAVSAYFPPDLCEFANGGRPNSSGTTVRNPADPSLDADGGAQGSHVIRHVREHPLPRVLPSSRSSEVRILRLMAHSRILRASGCALPSCERNSEATVLGARDTGAMADRLATQRTGVRDPVALGRLLVLT
jgi:hypothetical protein